MGFDAGQISARADLALDTFQANLQTALQGLAQLDAAMQAVAPARLTLDTAQFSADVQQAQAQLAGITSTLASTQAPTLTLDTTAFTQSVTAAEAAVGTLSTALAAVPEGTVSLDIAALQQQVATADTALATLAGTLTALPEGQATVDTATLGQTVTDAQQQLSTLAAALAGLPPGQATIDTAALTPEVAQALAALQTLSGALTELPPAIVTVDASQAQAGAAQVQQALAPVQAAAEQPPTVAPKVDPEPARTGVQQIQDLVGRLGTSLQQALHLDTAGLGQSFAAVEQALGGVVGQFAGLAGAPKEIAALGAAGEGAATALQGLATGSVAATAGITAVVGAAAVATKQLYDLGAAFDDAHDRMVVLTGETGPKLDAFNASFERVAATGKSSLTDIATATSLLGQRTGLVGAELDAASAAVLRFGSLAGGDTAENVRLVTRLTTQWGLAATETGTLLDALFARATAAGAAPRQFAENLLAIGPAARGLGFALGDTLTILSQFERAGVDQGTAVTALNLAYRKLAAEGVADVGLAFRDQVIAIQTARDSTQAGALAADLFGRQSARMADAIRQGALDIRGQSTAISESSGAINRAIAEIKDPIDRLINAWQALLRAFGPEGTVVFGAVGLVFEGLAAQVQSVAAGVRLVNEGLAATGRAAQEVNSRVAAVAAQPSGLGPTVGAGLLASGGAPPPQIVPDQSEAVDQIRRLNAAFDEYQRNLDQTAAKHRVYLAAAQETDKELAQQRTRFIEAGDAMGLTHLLAYQTALQDLGQVAEKLAPAVAAGFLLQRRAIDEAFTVAFAAAQEIEDAGARLAAADAAHAQRQQAIIQLSEAAKAAAEAQGAAEQEATQRASQAHAVFIGFLEREAQLRAQATTGPAQQLVGALTPQLTPEQLAQAQEVGNIARANAEALALQAGASEGVAKANGEAAATTATLNAIAQTLGLSEGQVAEFLAGTNAQISERIGRVTEAEQAQRRLNDELRKLPGSEVNSGLEQLARTVFPALTAAQREYVIGLLDVAKASGQTTDFQRATAEAYRLVGAGALDAGAAARGSAADFQEQQRVLQAIVATANPAANAQRAIGEAARQGAELVFQSLSRADVANEQYVAARTSDVAELQRLAARFGIDPAVVAQALQGSATEFQRFLDDLKQRIDTANIGGNAARAEEAAAKQMIETLIKGLPEIDKAWERSVAARQGQRATLRELYEQMGGDLAAFVNATAQQQQRLVDLLARQQAAREQLASTGVLAPAPAIPPEARGFPTPDVNAPGGNLPDAQREFRVAIQAAQDDFRQAMANIAEQLRAADIAFIKEVGGTFTRLGEIVREEGTIPKARRAAGDALAQAIAAADTTLQDAQAKAAETLAQLAAQAAKINADFNRERFRADRAFAEQQADSLEQYQKQRKALIEQLADSTAQASFQIGDALDSATQRILDVFQQISAGAAAAAQQLRAQLEGKINLLFQPQLPLTGGEQRPVDPAVALALQQQQTQAILQRNLDIAERARQEQAILDLATRARGEIDKQVTALQSETAKTVERTARDAAKQRDEQVRALRELDANFAKQQDRAVRAFEESRADAFRVLDEALAANRAARDAALRQLEAAQRQHDETIRRALEQHTETLAQLRHQEDEARAQHQETVYHLQHEEDEARHRFFELTTKATLQLNAAYRQIGLLEAIAAKERPPIELTNEFNGMIVVEPATQFLELGAEQLRRELASGGVG